MLNALKSLFLHSEEDTDTGNQFDASDKRLSVAALMFHVVLADGFAHENELDAMRRILSRRFSLTDAETEELMEAAHKADLEAVDLYTFTRVLIRELDEAERIEIVGELWRMVYADGDVHEVEDNIVWRVSELLGVSARDRMLAKQDARGEQ